MNLDQNDFSEFHLKTISAFNLILLSKSSSLKTNKNEQLKFDSKKKVRSYHTIY